MLKTKTTSSSGGLTMKHKIGYALGDAGGCMTFVIIGKFFSNYCTDVLFIDEKLLAILLLIWNVWDFLNDPIMGGFLDKAFAKRLDRRGKFRPWLLRSAPLVCVSFIALFSVPTLFEGVATLISLFALKVIYEAFYTMFNIPMGSLLSAMSTNEVERTKLSSARGIGSAIGSVVPIMVMPYFLDDYAKNDGTGYFIGAAICAVLGLGFSIGHYFFTEERVQTPIESENQDIKLTDIFKVFAINRPFLALCIHGFSICLMQTVSETISTYFYDGAYGETKLMSMGMAVTGPIMLLTFIICPKIAEKTGLIKFIRYSLIAGAAFYVGFFILHITCDVGPYAHMILSGIALGLASVSIYMQWGFLGEVIDYNEMLTGKRTEGSIYGTFNLARRVGQTIAMSLAIYMLDVFKYDNEIDIQGDYTILGFKIIGILLPAIFTLGSWIAFKFVWNLDEATSKKVAEFKTQKLSSGK